MNPLMGTRACYCSRRMKRGTLLAPVIVWPQRLYVDVEHLAEELDSSSFSLALMSDLADVEARSGALTALGHVVNELLGPGCNDSALDSIDRLHDLERRQTLIEKLLLDEPDRCVDPVLEGCIPPVHDTTVMFNPGRMVNLPWRLDRWRFGEWFGALELQWLGIGHATLLESAHADGDVMRFVERTDPTTNFIC